MVSKPPVNFENSSSLGDSSLGLKRHPEIRESQKRKRAIQTPTEVEGKWKAVKLIIKDNHDRKKVRVETVKLGDSFVLKDTNLTITVGTFFPNFVMDKSYFTSVGNETTNPAVQFIVHKKDKRIFEGWAFKRFPKLYAFEHERYEIFLADYIPMEVS